MRHRVLAWTGTRVEILVENDDVVVARKHLRATTLPAALVTDGRLVDVNRAGASRGADFARAIDAAPAPSAARPLPRQVPTEPMPPRDAPPEPAAEPAPQRRPTAPALPPAPPAPPPHEEPAPATERIDRTPPAPQRRPVVQRAPTLAPAPQRRRLTLDEALALVEQHARLVARLGGEAGAEQLAQVVEAHGGPAVVVGAIERVMAAAAAAEGR